METRPGTVLLSTAIRFPLERICRFSPGRGPRALAAVRAGHQYAVSRSRMAGRAPRHARRCHLQRAAPDLWIGGVVRSDGSATPAIRQIRIDYGRDTYLKYLPAIYRADPASSDLLDRLLSLSQTALGACATKSSI